MWKLKRTLELMMLACVFGIYTLLTPVKATTQPHELVVQTYDPPTLAQQTKKKVEWCSNNNDCTVLREASYYEARGESDIGVVSVMHTILNRVEHKNWPNTVHGVVHKYKHFSYLTDGSVDQGMKDNEQVERLSVLAYDVLHGLIESPIGGVTHYHSINVTPYWVSDVDYVAHVGNHIFYRGDR